MRPSAAVRRVWMHRGEVMGIRRPATAAVLSPTASTIAAAWPHCCALRGCLDVPPNLGVPARSFASKAIRPPRAVLSNNPHMPAGSDAGAAGAGTATTHKSSEKDTSPVPWAHVLTSTLSHPALAACYAALPPDARAAMETVEVGSGMPAVHFATTVADALHASGAVTAALRRVLIACQAQTRADAAPVVAVLPTLIHTVRLLAAVAVILRTPHALVNSNLPHVLVMLNLPTVKETALPVTTYCDMIDLAVAVKVASDVFAHPLSGTLGTSSARASRIVDALDMPSTVPAGGAGAPSRPPPVAPPLIVAVRDTCLLRLTEVINACAHASSAGGRGVGTAPSAAHRSVSLGVDAADEGTVFSRVVHSALSSVASVPCRRIELVDLAMQALRNAALPRQRVWPATLLQLLESTQPRGVLHQHAVSFLPVENYVGSVLQDPRMRLDRTAPMADVVALLARLGANAHRERARNVLQVLDTALIDQLRAAGTELPTSERALRSLVNSMLQISVEHENLKLSCPALFAVCSDTLQAVLRSRAWHPQTKDLANMVEFLWRTCRLRMRDERLVHTLMDTVVQASLLSVAHVGHIERNLLHVACRLFVAGADVGIADVAFTQLMLRHFASTPTVSRALQPGREGDFPLSFRALDALDLLFSMSNCNTLSAAAAAEGKNTTKLMRIVLTELERPARDLTPADLSRVNDGTPRGNYLMKAFQKLHLVWLREWTDAQLGKTSARLVPEWLLPLIRQAAIMDVARRERRGSGAELKALVAADAASETVSEEGMSLFESVLSQTVTKLARSQGFAPPTVGYLLPDLGVLVDLAWPDARIALEIDGQTHFEALSPAEQAVHMDAFFTARGNDGAETSARSAASQALANLRASRSGTDAEAQKTAVLPVWVQDPRHMGLSQISHTLNSRSILRHDALRALGWRVYNITCHEVYMSGHGLRDAAVADKVSTILRAAGLWEDLARTRAGKLT